MSKINYKNLWIETGARDNGVGYSTFYDRLRWKKQSLEEAARPPRNARELSKSSCLAGQERDRNSVGFRPLLGDGERLNRVLVERFPEDTKQDVMALILREWLDRQA